MYHGNMYRGNMHHDNMYHGNMHHGNMMFSGSYWKYLGNEATRKVALSYRCH